MDFLAPFKLFTTAAYTEADPTVENTFTVKNTRLIAAVYYAVGVITGPWVHRKIGMKPLF